MCVPGVYAACACVFFAAIIDLWCVKFVSVSAFRVPFSVTVYVCESVSVCVFLSVCVCV